MTRVKVCGITREEELDMTRRADHVGLVVATGTRRSLAPARARLLAELSSAPTVMVTTAATAEAVLELAAMVEPEVVQTYRLDAAGLEEVRERGFEVWAAMPVGGRGDIGAILEISRSAQAIVLETPSPQGGGSGTTHDWERSAAIRSRLSVPVVLAGGLSPDNVAAAIGAVRPDEVDVSTGVETDGRKDALKVARFIEETTRCQT